MTSLYLLLAFVSGSLFSVQVGINHSLRTAIGNPALSALVSFAVGTVSLIVFALLTRASLPSLDTLARLPAWNWAGGVLGAFIVAVAIYAAPKLGAANLMVLTIAGQLTMSVVLDHFGWIGFPEHPVNLPRIVGMLLLFGGCLLVVRS